MTTSKTSPSAAPAKNRAPKNSKQNRSLTIIFFLALIAIGNTVYVINANRQLQQGVDHQFKFILTQINKLKEQQIDTKDTLTTALQTSNETQNKLQEKINGMDKELQTAIQQSMYQSKDWLLLKARYYLELAQINAHWGDNLQLTSTLLEQADTLLASFSDQRLFTIRQAIAKEIAMLKAMPKVDIAGILSRLDAALSNVGIIPLKLTAESATKTKALTATDEKNPSMWRSHLQKSITLLEKLVVVRRQDADMLPLPSPAYESMLREGIRLNIQEAQWAVLQNNEKVYQFSLAQALKNIDRSFATDAATTTALINQLQSLQELHLNQQKPILEQSLPLLNQLIESKGMQAIQPIGSGDKS